jgi:hypothetical protein
MDGASDALLVLAFTTDTREPSVRKEGSWLFRETESDRRCLAHSGTEHGPPAVMPPNP